MNIILNNLFSNDECDLLYSTSILHDICKISTLDSILVKPSSLRTIKYKIIQEHFTTNYEILSSILMYKEFSKFYDI